MNPITQILDFTVFLLTYAGAVEYAAAEYGSDGRVSRVLPAHLVVRGQDDITRLLPWLRAKNAGGHNIWARPAAPDHPLIMLDDLPSGRAIAVTRKYAGTAVETTPGNAQVWIVCDRMLTRKERQDVACALCARIGSDPGAISEPRWGRLPGFKQKKPGKTGWTNLLAVNTEGRHFNPGPFLTASAPLSAPRLREAGGGFTSEHGDVSRREFAFACHSLRAGLPPDVVAQRIADHVAATGRRKSRDYARRTVAAVLARLRAPVRPYEVPNL